MAIVFDPSFRYWQYKDSGTVKVTKDVNPDEPEVSINSIETTINTDNNSNNEKKISYYDIDDVDVTNCTFSEFCKAIKFVKENCSTIDFDEKLLNSFSNQFSEDEKVDFYKLFDDYRLDCARNGNILLFQQYYRIELAAYNVKFRL